MNTMPKYKINKPTSPKNIAEILDELTHISPEILNYIEHCLEIWANWHRGKDQHGLDYCPVTIEYRLMKLGCIPYEASSGPKVLPSNSTAEEMETAIKIMASQPCSQHYAKALREYHLSSKEKDAVKAAKRMGIRKETLYRYLRGACTWLTGWYSQQLTLNLIKMKPFRDDYA